MKYKAVIFDLDMTLIDSKKAESLRNRRKWLDVYKLISELKPYDGINDLLKVIKKENIKIAIVTSSPRPYCERVIAHNKWTIDVTICYHDTKNRKPYPDPLLKASTEMNIIPDNIITAGDKDIDIISSRNAKMKSIGCLWGTENHELLLKSNPDFVANIVNDLYSLLIEN